MAAQETGESAAWDDQAVVLHEEVRRLPERYRAPVVLCDLEGQTHEEAARNLHCPVGTVKGRLFRARRLLRDRLGRRGVALSMGGIGAALGREAAEAAVPRVLVEFTVRTALGGAVGGAVAAGLASATALALARGVMRAMFYQKLKLGAVVLLGAGVIATGAGVRAFQDGGGERAGGSAAAPAPAGEPAEPDLNAGVHAQDLRRLKAANDAFNLARTYYGNGTISVDRYLDASRRLLEAERAVQDSKDRRLGVIAAHVKRLQEILAVVEAARGARIGGEPDVAEARLAVEEAKAVLVHAKADAATELERGGSGPLAESMGEMAGAAPPDDDEDGDPERDEAIRAALNKRAPVHFKDEVPLGDALKYIKENTTSKELPSGIPIYVDPVGMAEAEKTMASPVTLDLEGVRLKVSLRLILKQLDLGYIVKDGMVQITGIHSDEYQGELVRQARARSPMTGRGMMPGAGMGGGMMRGGGGAGGAGIPRGAPGGGGLGAGGAATAPRGAGNRRNIQ
jgi:hypothetical protein